MSPLQALYQRHQDSNLVPKLPTLLPRQYLHHGLPKYHRRIWTAYRCNRQDWDKNLRSAQQALVRRDPALVPPLVTTEALVEWTLPFGPLTNTKTQFPVVRRRTATPLLHFFATLHLTIGNGRRPALAHRPPRVPRPTTPQIAYVNLHSLPPLCANTTKQLKELLNKQTAEPFHRTA